MSLLILVILVSAVFFVWKHNKEKTAQKAAEMLARLDRLGEVRGKSIGEIQSVLGTPLMRKGSDNDPNIVQFIWNVGTVSILANWDKKDDNEKIVSFVRSDRQ